MDIGPPPRAIGEIVRPVLVAAVEKVIEADRPGSHNMLEHPIIRALRSSGWEAKRRGATISVVHHGLLVAKAGKSELVRFDQIECDDVLFRALDRVTARPEIAGGD